MRAREMRLAAEQAPPLKAQLSVWDCPDDLVNTRTPKQVRAYRRQDVLGHMARSGCNVSKDMLIASRLFQATHDGATIGYSSGDPLQDRVGGSPPGPSMGPSKNSVRQITNAKDVARILACLGSAAAKMLVHVLIHNMDIAAWCRMHRDDKLDRKREMGKLLAALTHLVEIMGVDTARDRARNAQRGEAA